MSHEKQPKELFLELGDIIKFNSPLNKEMDKTLFFIDYLDENRATLINTETLQETIFNILNNKFVDENIESIELLSRPEEKGFARQNGLLPGAWITIQFGGEVPIIINGEITNLDEDMIELTTYIDKKKIYIDFSYKGIPLDLPIENIKPFEAPQEQLEIPDISISPKDGSDLEISDLEDDEEGFVFGSPVEDVSPQIKKTLLDADSIVFGEKLDSVTEYIPVKEEEHRYGIETQTNDLLDDLLSTIPSNKRTPRVLNQIHIMIERFKQLREIFSKMTNDGIDKPIVKTAQYKPLIERLQKLNKKLYWLLPIIKNKKKLYNIDYDLEEDNIDFIPTTLAESQTDIDLLINEFKQNRIPDGQNKYLYLYRRLNFLLTPFTIPTDKSNIIIQKDVNANLLAIVDNLEDFYSTVAKNHNTLRHRFLLTVYNEGLSHLESRDIKKPLQSASRQLISENDTMAITGFLMLPEPALNYSYINLPNTSILTKAQLNKLTFNYFSILNKNTSIISKEITEGIEDPSYNEKKYLKHITAVKFEQVISYDDREKSETYKKYLEAFVPKTKELFNLIKKFIIKHKGGTSYLKNVEYLAPFLIYPDDITFKQYENIVRFMEERILNLKREFINQTTDIKYYLNAVYGGLPRNLNSSIFNIFDVKDSTMEELYSIKAPISSIQLLNDIQNIDNGRLFSTYVALKDIDLYQPINITKILEDSQKQNEDDEEEEGEINETTDCRNLVLAKYYMDIDELREDDNTNNVYFDEKYDTTRYAINDEFIDSRDSMDDNAYREFIFTHLMKNVGLTEPQAVIESEALTNKQRRVTEGDYAYLEDTEGISIYYKRVGNTWIRDGELDGQPPGNRLMFCNIKKNCIQIKQNCGSISLNKNKLRNELTQEILNQFDLEFNMEFKQLKDKLNDDMDYYINIIPALKLINLYKFLKNDLKFQEIGDTLHDRTLIISPFANLRDHILSQTDFVIKQSNILTFVSRFCRDPQYSPTSEQQEDQYWYYCKTTNIPLLPTFYNDLAEAFQIGEYKNVLERISAQRGEISDDGEKIVDKYSGYIIRTIEYDTSEGYDETGYKIISREILEKDIGAVLMELDYKLPSSLKSPDAEMISRVLITLDKNLGIKIDSEYDFIIKNVTEAINHYIGAKTTYLKRLKKLQQRGKKGISYERAHDETLMIFTLAYYLISIQTMIPSIITKKTFPSCIRSFNGYPLDMDGDASALLYIVCATLKIRQSTRPWSTLPKIKRSKEDSITMKYVEKIKKQLTVILENAIVKQKLDNKREYLKQHIKDEDIPELFNVKQWDTFLPPLYPIKMKQISNISDGFFDVLITNFKKGSINQFDQLNTVRGKIIAFSFHIQELIQRVINKEAPILKNLSDEPLLENACCNEGIKETLQYFIEKEKRIVKYNSIVENLEKILDITYDYQTVNYIYSPLDTHLKYPQLAEDFSEQTMYISFLRFCDLNITLSSAIQRLCEHSLIKTFSVSTDSNEYQTITIHDKITQLKHEGINITRGIFNQMLKDINKFNIVDINLHPVILSERKLLEIQIDNLKKKHTNNICNIEILDTFTSLLDTFDTVKQGDNDGYLKMQVFLDENIDIFKTQIITFLTSLGVTTNIEHFLTNVTNWKLRGENIYITQTDETSITMFTFYDTFIKNMMRVYPNMIINGVDYKNVKIPSNWKLSEIHTKDIQSLLFGETSSLQKFYKDAELFPILEHIQSKSKDIIDLMNATTLFADLVLNDSTIEDTIINGNILNKLIEFYLMCSMYMYIKALEMNLEGDTSSIGTAILLDLVDNEGMEESVREQIIEGKREELNKKIAQLLGTYINIMQNQKNKLNINNEDIIKNVLKAKEKEKNKVTKRLGDLTVEEREIENILKNHRLGNWNLGQTRALFEYDADQYDKERKEIEDDFLMELRLNKRDEVTDRNREIYRLEEIEEQVQQERRNSEIQTSFAAMADDDDFGDRDGDEYF